MFTQAATYELNSLLASIAKEQVVTCAIAVDLFVEDPGTLSIS